MIVCFIFFLSLALAAPVLSYPVLLPLVSTAGYERVNLAHAWRVLQSKFLHFPTGCVRMYFYIYVCSSAAG